MYNKKHIIKSAMEELVQHEECASLIWCLTGNEVNISLQYGMVLSIELVGHFGEEYKLNTLKITLINSKSGIVKESVINFCFKYHEKLIEANSRYSSNLIKQRVFDYMKVYSYV